MRHLPHLFSHQADPVYHSEVGPKADLTTQPISSSVQENKTTLLTLFAETSDLIIQELVIHTPEPHPALIMYIDGLNDPVRLDQHVLRPLLEPPGVTVSETTNLLDALEKQLLPMAKLPRVQTIGEALDMIFDGEAVLLIEGETSGLSFPIRTWPGREITKPESEPLVRGPQEGFCECLFKNSALLRERLKTPDFKSERLIIGRYTQSWVKVFYIQGIVKPELVDEVKQRLAQIDIDGIIDSGYIEELIEDDTWSPFPQVDHSERPDKVAAALLSGRVAIMVDKSNAALIVPVTLFHWLGAAEDYYIRSLYGTALRVLRMIAFWLALLLPSIYIAVTTFHIEMIPTELAISLAAQRERVPFPALVEALMMEIVFEILREAGLRLPRPVGQTVSIVGALVVGDAAVNAGLISPAMVIVVALTGIASMAIPGYDFAFGVRLLRIPLMILASVLGLIGTTLGVLALLVHLAGLRSFGFPYLDPIASSIPGDLKDSLIRAPWWALVTRPRLYSNNQQRMATGMKPRPERGKRR